MTNHARLQAEGLLRLSGFEIAQMIGSKTPSEKLAIFQHLPPQLAAEVFDHLSLKNKKYLVHGLTLEKASAILQAMPPDDRTAFLEELPKKSVSEYLALFSEGDRKETLTLLGYPEDTVGHYMTTDFIAVKKQWTVAKVFEHIRAYGHDSETINVIYVTDDECKLIDDFRIKELLFVQPSKMVSEITDGKYIALRVNEKVEEATHIFTEHDRVALPVVDDTNKLIGIVTIDDILRLVNEETTEDMQKLAGLEALEEPYMETPFLELIKKRAGWLVVLFIGEMFTATAMGFFEAEIAKAVVLALFLPLIISSGGNAGSQSTTLIIRAMALGEVGVADWWRVMRREILTGLALGTILGLIGFLRVGVWGAAFHMYGEHWFLLAGMIFFSLIGVVLWGSLAGSMLPILLKRMKFDPAASSAPLVATLVDVTGITIYFAIAMLLLKGALL